MILQKKRSDHTFLDHYKDEFLACLIKAAQQLTGILRKNLWFSMTLKNPHVFSRQSKIHRHNHTSPIKILVQDIRFEHVYIDIVGLLLPFKDFRYLLTMIYSLTGSQPEAVPQDCTADTVAKMFFTHWIVRFGTPCLIITDQGSQFEAQLFDALISSILNIVGQLHTIQNLMSSNNGIVR